MGRFNCSCPASEVQSCNVGCLLWQPSPLDVLAIREILDAIQRFKRKIDNRDAPKTLVTRPERQSCPKPSNLSLSSAERDMDNGDLLS